ncbi:MAG TPA: ATP-binding protein [Vicinamibacterales bacterium]|nr:ATP-binding protein [Vicinamibacterales bacterium]
MDLRSRLSTLIAVRLVVGTLLLGSAILIQISRPGSFPVDPFFFLIGLTYALSVVYLATLRLAERHPWLVDVQFAADAILVSAFIGITGGITSYYSSLYLLPIIAASTIRFRRGALQLAGLSAVLYLALVSAQYLDALPTRWQPEALVDLPSGRFAQYTVGINLFGFFAVALLSGSLAEGLRSADARLEHASHQIEDLRAFNEYVIDSLLSGLATADEHRRILTFNRAASIITGVPALQAIGADAAEVLQLGADARESLARLRDTRSLRVDVQYRTGDGRLVEIGMTAATLQFPDGRAGYLFTFQDVTDMKRLERDARLQQRLAAVGEMAAGIAHEIRNPLASMSGSIQVLRHELALSEEQAQLMDIVLRESERLNDTIRSFLAYARPQRFAVARLDVRTVVQDTAVLLRNGPDVKQAHVIDVDVPAEPVWFEADENQIRQVVWNLATNGLRAMPRGGRLRLSADLDAPDGDGDVVLTVADQGCGIPADQLDGIFQPFRSSFEKGTGLGLAIVHRIVTDYGGAIHVSSTVDTGTIVRVRLPVRASAGGAAPRRGAGLSGLPGEPAGSARQDSAKTVPSRTGGAA